MAAAGPLVEDELLWRLRAVHGGEVPRSVATTGALATAFQATPQAKATQGWVRRVMPGGLDQVRLEGERDAALYALMSKVRESFKARDGDVYGVLRDHAVPDEGTPPWHKGEPTTGPLDPVKLDCLLVIESMPSPFREIARLAAITLMRLGEIRPLQREHVYLEQGIILLPQAKAAARSVILSVWARKILQGQLERRASKWVFPGPDSRPYSREHIGRMFRKATRGAGLKDLHFHHLRYHGARMALDKGFTAPIVMALDGWKTERMMRRYAALTERTLRAAAEAVSGGEVTLEEVPALPR